MRIGEWDTLGSAQLLLQAQMSQLGATELATHVTVNPDNGRMRILVATEECLIDYGYMPAGGTADSAWILRGTAVRWPSVRGLRLVTDAQLDMETAEPRSVWRFVAEEPRIELTATSDQGEGAIEAMLAFARACLQSTG